MLYETKWSILLKRLRTISISKSVKLTANLFFAFIFQIDVIEKVTFENIALMTSSERYFLLIWRHMKAYLFSMLLTVVVLRVVNVMARIASAVTGSEPISILYVGKLQGGRLD